MLQCASFTEFYRVFYLVDKMSPSSIRSFEMVTSQCQGQGKKEFYRVFKDLPSFSKIYRVGLNSMEIERVLPSFTEFSWLTRNVERAGLVPGGLVRARQVLRARRPRRHADGGRDGRHGQFRRAAPLDPSGLPLPHRILRAALPGRHSGNSTLPSLKTNKKPSTKQTNEPKIDRSRWSILDETA